jgi:hypothetical protein
MSDTGEFIMLILIVIFIGLRLQVPCALHMAYC